MTEFKKLICVMLLGAMLLTQVLCIAPIVSGAEEAIENLYDSRKAVSGYYLGGELKKNASYYASGSIKANGGDTVYIGITSPKYLTYPVIGCYGKDGAFLKDIKIGEVTEITATSKEIIVKAVLPEGTASVRVNFKKEYRDGLAVTVNQEMTAENYYDIVGKDKPDINFNSPLFGKKVIFFGDSITEAACERSDSNHNPERLGWAGRIGYDNGMDYTNAGIGGASLSTIRGTNQIINQLPKKGDYDLVILHGGVNDVWNAAPVAMGKMTEGFDGEYNIDTFAGGLENLFSEAKKRYPGATFGFIINYDIPSLSSMGLGSYFNLAKKICDKWEIPYLDLYSNKEVKAALKVGQPGSLTANGDNVHPNTAGYDVITPLIEEWMESLITPAAEPTPTPTPTPEVTPAPATPDPSTPDAETAAPDSSTPEATKTPEAVGENNTLKTALIIGGAVLAAAAITAGVVLLIKKKK